MYLMICPESKLGLFLTITSAGGTCFSLFVSLVLLNNLISSPSLCQYLVTGWKNYGVQSKKTTDVRPSK